MSKFDVIVIGNGITGLTAAKQLAQNGLSVASIECMLFGGLVTNINELDRPPAGAPESGMEFASNLMMEISDLGVNNIAETVTALARDGDSIVVTTDADKHQAKAVIVASGAQLKRLGIPGEMEFDHKGVSQCADCDGPMYQNEDVVVVGGGDSALQEAIVLAHFCKTVHLVHRGDKFDAHQSLIDVVAKESKIKPIWNSVAEEVGGGEMVTKVSIKDLKSGAKTEIPCAGFFAYVGLQPNSDFVPAEAKRDANGNLITDDKLATSIPGVFAAGAVRAGYKGMLTDAIDDAKKVADSAKAKVRGKRKRPTPYNKSVAMRCKRMAQRGRQITKMKRRITG